MACWKKEGRGGEKSQGQIELNGGILQASGKILPTNNANIAKKAFIHFSSEICGLHL